MTEKQWARQDCSTLPEMAEGFWQSDASAAAHFHARDGFRLANALGIKHCGPEPENRPEITTMEFQADLPVAQAADGSWQPGVVIELNPGEPHTHDAITYCQKSSARMSVHPYPRYGIPIGSVSATRCPTEHSSRGKKNG